MKESTKKALMSLIKSVGVALISFIGTLLAGSDTSTALTIGAIVGGTSIIV